MCWEIISAQLTLITIKIGQNKNMKKIVIFSTVGGGGHVSVVESLNAALGQQYQITTIDIFQDVLFTHSFFKNIGNPIRLYNYFLRKNMIFFCNIFAKLGAIFFSFKNKSTTTTLHNYLKTEQPDLVISVIPFVNAYIGQAAQKLNTPFLIVSSDISAKLYLLNFKKHIDKKTHETSKKLPETYIATPFPDYNNQKLLLEAGIKEKNSFVVGASIRPRFLYKKNRLTLQEKWGVNKSLPTIMLMMGAQGSESTITYCKKLTKVTTPINLIVCVGKNSALKQQIQLITFPKTISIRIIEFTQDIDELMTIADLLISKSGSLSVCESIYQELPILLDATTTVLTLEKPNHPFIAQHAFGESLTDIDKVSSRIDDIFAHPAILEQWRYHLSLFKKKNSQVEIPKIITDILASAKPQ